MKRMMEKATFKTVKMLMYIIEMSACTVAILVMCGAISAKMTASMPTYNFIKCSLRGVPQIQ